MCESAAGAAHVAAHMAAEPHESRHARARDAIHGQLRARNAFSFARAPPTARQGGAWARRALDWRTAPSANAKLSRPLGGTGRQLRHLKHHKIPSYAPAMAPPHSSSAASTRRTFELRIAVALSLAALAVRRTEGKQQRLSRAALFSVGGQLRRGPQLKRCASGLWRGGYGGAGRPSTEALRRARRADPPISAPPRRCPGPGLMRLLLRARLAAGSLL